MNFKTQPAIEHSSIRIRLSIEIYPFASKSIHLNAEQSIIFYAEIIIKSCPYYGSFFVEKILIVLFSLD